MTRLHMRRTHRLGMAAVLALDTYSRRSIDGHLYELIKLRASHLNGCRYCIDLHSRALRERGESTDRLTALCGTPSADHFTPRELAALQLTDTVTRLAPEGVTDSTWRQTKGHFNEAEIGNLILGIATINVWNRIAVTTRMDESM